MTADEAVVAVLDALDTAGVPYMIVGSLAIVVIVPAPPTDTNPC